MQRQSLKALSNKLKGFSLAHSPSDQYILFKDGRGRVLFQVSHDDLFDADGNRFEDDLP